MADLIGRRNFLKSVPLVSAGAGVAAGSAGERPGALSFEVVPVQRARGVGHVLVALGRP